MLVSPFTFYRGAAAIMAGDLAGTPRSGVTVQLCGDAHMSNFGAVRDARAADALRRQRLRRDLPGPWEWDVKRLAASFEVGGRDRGFAATDRRAIVLACVRAYRSQMRRAAGMGTLDAWYDQLDVERLLDQVRREVGAAGCEEGGAAGRGGHRQGADARQRARVRAARGRGRRRAADPARTHR